MKDFMGFLTALAIIWMPTITFVYLVIDDARSGQITGWEWLLAIPLDLILAALWPVYWILTAFGL